MFFQGFEEVQGDEGLGFPGDFYHHFFAAYMMRSCGFLNCFISTTLRPELVSPWYTPCVVDKGSGAAPFLHCQCFNMWQIYMCLCRNFPWSHGKYKQMLYLHWWNIELLPDVFVSIKTDRGLALWLPQVWSATLFTTNIASCLQEEKEHNLRSIM